MGAHAALDKQAEDVVVLDLRGISTITDFFVIGTAGSTRQLEALRDHIEVQLTAAGGTVWHTEGLGIGVGAVETGPDGPHWVLLDCGELVVHLLDQRARGSYRLEELWADAPRLALSPGS